MRTFEAYIKNFTQQAAEKKNAESAKKNHIRS